MPVAEVPAIHIKKREPLVLVEYQRAPGYPWMVAGVYNNLLVAQKAIKRLGPLMEGTPSFRTR